MSNSGSDGAEPFVLRHSTFSLNRRTRPLPINYSSGVQDENQEPLRPNKLQRRESKGGLRGIFTRNKTGNTLPFIISPVLEEPHTPVMADRSGRGARVRTLRPTVHLPPTVPRLPVTPPKSTSSPSRMNMQAKSVKPVKSALKSSPKSSTKSSSKHPTRSSAAWDPPPLFQAYPQAIKHATLSASTLSADAILRISNHKRNASIRDGITQTGNGDSHDQSATVKKAEKAKGKHRRQISGSISKAEWTQKIYVLVPSGYLLQYAGEGSFDRLPEKMMQLGKDSVAFASDVIPGKHWVLQISQSMNADGTPASDSRSLLSRLAFRGADYRRSATSMLLVLNSAEDLDFWIAAVRREIEALGGKKHVSETGKPKPDDKVMQLKAQPSDGYVVQPDPDQYANPSIEQSPFFGITPWYKDSLHRERSEETDSAFSEAQTFARPSTGHQSATTLSSHDGFQLQGLRDSGHRLSYMSSGQHTYVTSQESSPACSPIRDSFSTFEEYPSKLSMEDIRARPNALTIRESRRSMQVLPKSVLDVQRNPKSFRPHSTYDISVRPAQSRSPSAPNFSVPNSSSKRYSFAKSATSERPPSQTITTTIPSRPILKGTRKGPPTALTMTRTLSPVNDTSLPKATSPITLAESSFGMLQQPAAVGIPYRSLSILPSPTESAITPRVPSLAPLKYPETLQSDFEFPRRHSSGQIRYGPKQFSEAPTRTTPLPSPPFITGLYQDGHSIVDVETGSLSPNHDSRKTKHTLRSPTSTQPSSSVPPVSSSNSRNNSIFCPNVSATAASLATTSYSNPFQTRLPPRDPSSRDQLTLTDSTSKSPASLSLISPSFQRLRLESDSKTVCNRRSMPTLLNGPPPAPPPDYALPPLPPGSAGLRRPMGLRDSVRA